MGYWRVWTAQQLVTYHPLLPFLLLPLFTDVQLPFSHVHYISPLLYSDSESRSGDTQSSSCGSSQLRACAPSILHPMFFVPCPVTIVTIHSQLHCSSQLNWVYCPRCSHDDMFTIYQDLHPCLLFSLFIPLHVKP